MATTYQLRPVSAMTRSSSPTASSSTVSDRSPPPLNAHHPPTKTMLPPSTTSFSPIPTSARPRRPLSPTSLRDVDIPLDPERAFAARGKFPAPPTGHELMALFPPSPPPHPLCPTSAFFDREERKFFAQAGKEIVRLRLEVDTLGARGSPPGSVGSMSMPPPPVPVPGPSSSVSPRDRHARAQSQPQHQHQHQHAHSHSHQHPRPHQHQHQHQHAHPGSPHHDRPPATSHGAPQGPPLTTSPRVHVPPASFAPPPAPSTSGPAHPGYPVSRPPEHTGGGGEAMVVEDDDNDESWRRPTPHNARRRAGKHTRRVIVK